MNNAFTAQVVNNLAEVVDDTNIWPGDALVERGPE